MIKFKQLNLILPVVLFVCFFAVQSDAVEVESFGRSIPSRGVEAMAGKIAVTAAGSEGSLQTRFAGKLPLKFSFETRYYGIENSTAVEFPARLTGIIAGIETTLPFFGLDKTYLRVGLNPSFYTGNWNFRPSAFRIPANIFAIYVPDDKWTFLAGVAVYPDFDNQILPILGVIYKPNEKLTFNLVPKNPNISYSLNEKLTLLGVGGSSINSEFEVEKDNLKNVVLRYNESRLGAGVKYKLNKFIETSVIAGGVFNRSLKYRDSLGKAVIDNGVYTEFKMDIYL